MERNSETLFASTKTRGAQGAFLSGAFFEDRRAREVIKEE
jgi:hypothetical protein